MALPAARVGDLICTGIIVCGSCNVFVNCRPAALVGGGLVLSLLCGPTVLVAGSCSVFINGFPAAFLFSPTVCCEPVVTGSWNVFIGG